MSNTTAIYDRIGIGYDTSRQADPRIADEILALMAPEPGDLILDIACGTANYTGLLAARGLDMTGVDISTTMLDRAREKHPTLPLLQGSVDQLPVPDDSFDHVMCTLAIHHFPNLSNAFAEVARVLKDGRFVIFTATAEQTARYWLRHYFPNAFERALESEPSIDAITSALGDAGFNIIDITKWEVPHELQDRFAYAGKDNPAFYFEEGVMDGISLFSNLAEPSEVETGLKALRADIETGHWQGIRDSYDHDGGDYSFVVAQC